MAFAYPNWSAGNFAVGDKVIYNGVIYRALNTRTSTDTDNPVTDRDNWAEDGIVRIQDRESLYAAVRLEINVDNPMINDSVPFFVQLAEESFQTRIRAPIQRARMVLTVDDQSRIEVPEDLLQVINLRINSEDTGGDSLFSRGSTEILAGNYEEYQDLRRYYRSGLGFGLSRGRAIPYNYEAPVYWYDDRYFYIAPEMDMGTELELYYFAKIPQLGTTVNLVNQDGDPINSAGQTVAQWVAAGNTAGSFVQATDTVDVNWFITAKPDLLLYGAIAKAEAYLKDDPRMEIWRQKFERAEAETEDLITRFTEGRSHIQQLFNAYSV